MDTSSAGQIKMDALRITNRTPKVADFGALRHANDRFIEYSAIISTSTRALALSLVAVSWLFLRGFGDKPQEPFSQIPHLWLVSIALVSSLTSLAADLAQYLAGMLTYRRTLHDLMSVISEASDHANATRRNTEWAWARLADKGFVDELLRTRSDYKDLDLNDYASSIVLSKDVLKAAVTRLMSEPAGQTGLTPSPVEDLLNSAWNPRTNVRATSFFFWSKIALLTISSGALSTYVVLATICG